MVTVSIFKGQVELMISNGLNVTDERTNAPRREWLDAEEAITVALSLLINARKIIAEESASIKRNLVG